VRWIPPIPIRDQKIIIFDGPDGTGKTTLAQGLSLDLKLPYFKVSNERSSWEKNRFKEALDFYGPFVVDMIRQLKLNLIIDRGHPSEWVYSQVFGRETDMVKLRQIDDSLAAMGAYVIITLRHDYSNNRKDDLVPFEKLQELHAKYLEFGEWTRCGTIYLYVDSFDNDLMREVNVLRPELKFDDLLQFSVRTVLDRQSHVRDITGLFGKVS
jgi:hypothetical protein